MFELLVKIIPLDCASTLSPGIFALTVLILSSKQNLKVKLTSFFIGTLAIGVLMTLLGFSLGQAVPSEVQHKTFSNTVDLLLALVFFIFAFKILFTKDKSIQASKKIHGHLAIRWFLIGLIISATNFDAVFLNFAAAKEVGAAQIDIIVKIVLLVCNLLFFTLPITLPIVISYIFPQYAARVLETINRFVIKYSRYIIFVLFIVFAIVFLLQGLN